MRTILTLLIGLYSLHVIGQANDESDFKLKIKFDKSIPVSQLQPSYSLKAGNHLEKVSYELDITDNSMLITGHNDYVLWVSFPVLIFTLTDTLTPTHWDKEIEKSYSFYLISNGPLSSYTGTQTVDIEFSSQYAVIVASLEHHNKNNAFQSLKVERQNTYSGDANSIPLSNEIIKIHPYVTD